MDIKYGRKPKKNEKNELMNLHSIMALKKKTGIM
jgi:hypothetical protein